MKTEKAKDKKTEVTKDVKPLGNMKYGAPELVALYQRYAFRGLFSAIVFAIILLGSIVAYNKINAKTDKTKEITSNVITINEFDLPEIPKTVEVPPPADVPQAPKTVALRNLEALTPDPVAKEKSEVLSTETQKKLDDINVPVSSNGTDDISKVTAGTDDKFTDKTLGDKINREEPVKIKDDKPFQSFEVEKSPVAVNLSSVKNSMKYPEIAKASQQEGTCVAKILVGTNGEIIKIASISGPDVFRSEIEDKVMDLQFTPALKGGEAVRCYVNVPFKFTLGTQKKSTDE